MNILKMVFLKIKSFHKHKRMIKYNYSFNENYDEENFEMYSIYFLPKKCIYEVLNYEHNLYNLCYVHNYSDYYFNLVEIGNYHLYPFDINYHHSTKCRCNNDTKTYLCMYKTIYINKFLFSLNDLLYFFLIPKIKRLMYDNKKKYTHLYYVYNHSFEILKNWIIDY